MVTFSTENEPATSLREKVESVTWEVHLGKQSRGYMYGRLLSLHVQRQPFFILSSGLLRTSKIYGGQEGVHSVWVLSVTSFC